MIEQLNHSNEAVASQIYTVFQNSYKIEAMLIGTLNFPPLSRNTKNIADSTTNFYGFSVNGILAAVIEITYDNDHLHINSLTVEPSYFKQGIASKLINHVLTNHNFSQATVETAVVNIPAIKLYKKHGFVEFKRFTPDHGIEKLAMKINIQGKISR